MRRVDWQAVSLPDPERLAEFCEEFGTTADWVLFGREPQYRGQSRSPATLAADLAAAVHREVEAAHPLRQHVTDRHGWAVDGSELLKHVIVTIVTETAPLLIAAMAKEVRWRELRRARIHAEMFLAGQIEQATPAQQARHRAATIDKIVEVFDPLERAHILLPPLSTPYLAVCLDGELPADWLRQQRAST